MRPIQKQYERRVKHNHKNEAFTTFHRSQLQPHSKTGKISRQPPESHHTSEHERIQSLKHTLRTITPHLSAELSRHKEPTIEGLWGPQIDVETERYNQKLSRLTENLKEIAAKNHFSPAYPLENKQRRTGSQVSQKNQQKSQHLLDLYNPLKTQTYKRNNESKQMTLSKSHSFSNKAQASRPHNKSMHGLDRSSHPRGQQNASASKKSSDFKVISQQKMTSKQALFQEELASKAKNLAHLWDQEDDAIVGNAGPAILMRKKVHKSKVTNLLVADCIYSGSSDYSVAKIWQKEGVYGGQNCLNARGAITHFASLNGRACLSSKDSFLRSVDGNFFYRYDSIPLSFCDSDRNQATLQLLNNRVSLFDTQKRIVVSHFQLNSGFTLLSNHSKQAFIAQKDTIQHLDWRRPHVSQVIDNESSIPVHWFADPFSRRFCKLKGHELIEVDAFSNSRKIMGRRLEEAWEFKCADWSRTGLHLYFTNYADSTSALLRFNKNLQPETIDAEGQAEQVCSLAMRERHICYGCQSGEVIIKRFRR